MTRFPLVRFVLPAVVLWTVCLCGEAYGQLSIGWERQFGLAGATYPRGVSATAGGVYIAGFAGSGYPYNAFVRKYDLNGNELWTSQFGPPLGMVRPDAAMLAAGVGATADAVYVGGSGCGLDLQGSSGAFVRKYDVNGTELWTRYFGLSIVCSYANVYGVSGAADGVYLSGGSQYVVLPGQTQPSGGSFVLKYDFNGNVLWSHPITDSWVTHGGNVVAAVDGVYVVGVSGSGSFVLKYDPSGNELWTRAIGSAYDTALGVTLAADGAYVVGTTAGTLPGQTHHSPAGYTDTFVLKYDFDGNELWTSQFGASQGAFVEGVAATADGIFVLWNKPTIDSSGQWVSVDGFISEYDANGNALGVSPPLPASTESVAATSGGVFVAGESWAGQPFASVSNALVAMLVPGPVVPVPFSRVSSLPATEFYASFAVQWSGTDSGGPGIANYTIDYSDNGGPFTHWLTQTTMTQATFTGISGHTYGFYSIAQDSAGKTEAPKSAAEAATYVDAMKPVSHVSSLPATESSPYFTVQWSGTDVGGPGIANYSIYISDNGGPFGAWLTQTTATQSTFNGTNGHTYGFFSIAQDSYGQVENPKSGADATTLVQYPKPISHASSPNTPPSPNFLVQWSGTDAGGPGIGNYSIYVSDNGSAFTLWQANTSAAQAWYSGFLGHTYGFFGQAVDKVGNVENLKSTADATTHAPAQSAEDVNGDGQINCADVDAVKASFGKKTGQPGFNPAADVNKDGVVNVLDLAMATQKLIPGTVCQ